MKLRIEWREGNGHEECPACYFVMCDEKKTGYALRGPGGSLIVDPHLYRVGTLIRFAKSQFGKQHEHEVKQ